MIFGRGNSEKRSVTVDELRSTLSDFELFCESISAGGAAKDLKALCDALAPHGAKTVEAFCAQATTWLARSHAKLRGGKKSTGTRALPKKSGELNEGLIQSHVANLRQANIDRQVFTAAFERLQSDKSLRSPDLAEIARTPP